MARISTLIVLLALSLSSFAQLTVTLEDSTTCPGESIWFKASGMDLYGWSDTNNLDTIVGDSVNFMTTTPGTYTITAVGYTFFPADTDTVSFMVTVFSSPSPSITSSAGTTVCDGASTELVATAGFDSYMWSPAATLDNDSTDTVVATPSAATTYYLTVTDSNGCTGTDSIAISVTAGPSVSITSSADANNGYLCNGNSATLTAVGSGIASYEWSPTASLNDSTSMTVTATPSANTTYTVVVTDSNGCTNSATKAISVNSSLPSLTMNVAKDTVCFGQSTAITLQTNATDFSWSPAATVNNPNAKDVIVTPTTTTTYSVTVTRLGCSKTQSATIAVLPAPSVSATQSSGGATICLDETDEITVSCAECVSYVWKFPNSSLTTTSTTQTVSPNVAGAVQITITGIDDAGCSANTSVTVNVDSCFVGTPFGIGETAPADVTVLNRGTEIEFVSDARIEQLRLFNLLGEEVMQHTGAQNTVVVYSADLSEGLYIARLTTNGEEVVKKIYVQ